MPRQKLKNCKDQILSTLLHSYQHFLQLRFRRYLNIHGSESQPLVGQDIKQLLQGFPGC